MSSFDQNFALYEIATKAVLWNKDKILLLIRQGGEYDFPGGRMDKSEMKLDIFNVLAREMTEELGSKVKYSVKDFAFTSKRYYKHEGIEHNILALFFNVDYLSGEIELSDEHVSFSWISPKQILSHPEKFATKDEYDQYGKYIKGRLLRVL